MNITVTHELSFKAYYMSLKKKSNLYGEILMQEYLSTGITEAHVSYNFKMNKQNYLNKTRDIFWPPY